MNELNLRTHVGGESPPPSNLIKMSYDSRTGRHDYDDKNCRNCASYLPCELKLRLPDFDMKVCLAWEKKNRDEMKNATG